MPAAATSTKRDDFRGVDRRISGQELGAEIAGLDHRHLDAERRQFLRQALGDALDGEFGSAIPRRAGIAIETSERGEVEDVAAALGAQRRQHGAGDVDEAEHIGAELRLELLRRAFLKRAEQRIAGIVDQHFDPPEPLDGGLGRCGRLVGLGDVERHGEQESVMISNGCLPVAFHCIS